MLEIKLFQADLIGFEVAVHALTKQIPLGKVLGYGHLASLIGKPRHARHVGNALKNLNLENQIPWWRVLRSDGSIAMQGDLARGPRQIQKLQDEAIHFRSEHQIDIQRYRWQPEIT